MSGSDKFAGCIVGGLVGDCFGFPFELQDSNLTRVKRMFFKLDKMEGGEELKYTDDTAMAWNMLDSLLTKKYFHPEDMAQRFYETWEKEGYRLYGGHVGKVFLSWKKNQYSDVYGPARKQFKGSGSFGNGGAMRISPIALYWYDDPQEMNELVLSITKLTHTHPLGYVGALLQCWAVRIALGKDPTKNNLNSDDFINHLVDRLDKLDDPEDQQAKVLYIKELGRLKEFLRKKENTDIKEIVDAFGNEESAHRSILTAFFCFLRSASGPIKYLKADNPFERTIQLACCLGGDTDTIACMAGSIAGSYYGISGIPTYLPKHCEELARGIEFANSLHKRGVELNKQSK